MVTKNDFTSTEWSTLRDTPHLVGLGTLVAEPSGLGTIKELIALFAGISANQSSEIPLIRDLTCRPEVEAAQSAVKERFGGSMGAGSKEAVQTLALEQARSSMTILNGKASAEEINAYRRLLYNLAERVANASREGGFLGFGGKAVSPAEQTFLDELREAIQLERVKKA
jgi:hypothetical protein